MGIFDRFRKKVGTVILGKAWPDYTGSPTWRMTDVRTYAEEGFSINPLIYACIKYKASATVSAPCRAYTGDPDSPTKLPPEHPMSQLLLYPNEHQGRPEFQALNTAYLNVSGDSFVYVEREGNEIVALRPLRPDRVKILPKKVANGRFIPDIAGYLYAPEGTIVSLETGTKILPQDMIHTKFPNPLDPLEGMGYGLAPISPAARNADVDNAVNDFLKIFFEKGVILPGVLITEQPLDAKTIGRIRERWKEVYGGYKNWAEEIGILERGTTYQRIGLTFDEMGLEELDNRNETRICSVFGVPPILIGTAVALRNSSYKDYTEARTLCWEDTLIPESLLFESELQRYLNTDDFWVAYDFSRAPALRHQIKDRIESAWKMFNMGYTPAVSTRTVGLIVPSSAVSEISFLPLNMVAVLKEGQEMPETVSLGQSDQRDEAEASLNPFLEDEEDEDGENEDEDN